MALSKKNSYERLFYESVENNLSKVISQETDAKDNSGRIWFKPLDKIPCHVKYFKKIVDLNYNFNAWKKLFQQNITKWLL